MKDGSWHISLEKSNGTYAQHSVHPTSGSLRVFRQFAWLEVGSGKAALSRPAHQRVPLTPLPGRFAGVLRKRKPLGSALEVIPP